MLARFRVEGDPRGAGLREVRHDPIHWLDHQVHIDRSRDTRLAQCLADKRADRQVRHVVVVHHVEMDDVRAGVEHGAHLLAEPRESAESIDGAIQGCCMEVLLGRLPSL